MPVLQDTWCFSWKRSDAATFGSRGLNRHPGLWLATPQKRPQIARVSTLLEYEQLFGGPKSALFSVASNSNGVVTSVTHAVGQYPGRLGARVPDVLRAQPLLQNGGGACQASSRSATAA